MNTVQLNEVLSAHLSDDVFKGVHPASRLPVMSDEIKYPFCFVANTDCGHSPGQHWVAFYFDANGFGRYFDSFGRMPRHTDWINYLTGHSLHGMWDYCKAAIQSLDSEACGQYCIYYLINRHWTPLCISDYMLMHDVKESDVLDFCNALSTVN